MELQFEPDLGHQQDAIAAVCDLFRGQKAGSMKFSVPHNLLDQVPGFQKIKFGVGNDLLIGRRELLDNLRQVQIRNDLTPAESLQSLDFTVVMEIGTGKTYVYLRTIFELNRRYGFTKFVVVVPSLATKEGIEKSLHIIGPHLRTLYADTPCEHFVYDPDKLEQVWNFATSPQIQIMVSTVGAINRRTVGRVRQPNEKHFQLIGSTNPVLIVDEPQSTEGNLREQGRQVLAMMNPICTLRYSATHVDRHHMVYRLNTVDAYQRKLVKQTEAACCTIEDDYNRPYVRLVALHRKRSTIWAEVEVDVETAGGSVRRQKLKVFDGDELERKTRRWVYRSHLIDEICVKPGNEYMYLLMPSGYRKMRPGDIHSDINPMIIHREMIRKTIQLHLDKELKLRPHGIKVLTLFFIDEVARYRRYDDQGNPVKGEYARIFEENYLRTARLPKYSSLFKDIDLSSAAKNAHGGYFLTDRHGNWTDTSENDPEIFPEAGNAYLRIMRDKERLLEIDEPLRFIFSHSTLREGWDNPNVFQICTLRDMFTERKRRQTIGRGLRLCVNQEGKRQTESELNKLTIVAFGDFDDFADNLQKEIEQETGYQFEE